MRERSAVRSRGWRSKSGLSRPAASEKVMWKEVVAGACGGSALTLVLYPLNMVRTCLMSGESAAAVLATVRAAGVARLYKGLAPDLVVNMPYSILYMPVYEGLKSADVPKPLAASCAVAAASIATVPADIVTQRTQLGLHPTAAAAARVIVAKSGVKGLYKGLAPTLLRLCPHHAVQWTAYETLCAAAKANSGRERVTTGESAAIGGLSGALAALATQPLDVVKTRMQTRAGYATVATTVQRIAREEGIRAFGKGLVPRMLNIFPSTAIFYAVFEGVKTCMYAQGKEQIEEPQQQAHALVVNADEDDDDQRRLESRAPLERVSPGGALVPPLPHTRQHLGLLPKCRVTHVASGGVAGAPAMASLSTSVHVTNAEATSTD